MGENRYPQFLEPVGKPAQKQISMGLRRMVTNQRMESNERNEGQIIVPMGSPNEVNYLGSHSSIATDRTVRTVRTNRTNRTNRTHRTNRLKEYHVHKPAKKKGMRGRPEGLHYQDLIMLPLDPRGSPKPGMEHTLRGKGAEIDKRSLLYRIKQSSAMRNASEEFGMKMCFVVTLYNEDKKNFTDSMKGIIQSIYELQQSPQFEIHEDEIGIFFIADGLDKLNSKLVEYLIESGMYDEDLLEHELMCFDKAVDMDPSEEAQHTYEYLWKVKDQCGTNITKYQTTLQWDDIDIDDNPANNVLHLFQRRTNMNFGINFPLIEHDENHLPNYNYFFGVKHLNGGKLDSHLWFFRGLCGYLNPKYAFLIDLGTESRPNSISKLYKYMEANPNCGGCCGEIEVDTAVDTPFSFELMMVLVQFVEYKISHFIDKAFESLFGFVSVLPGAFSMYRWEAIQDQPLQHYFKGLDKNNLSCAQANMYLAEDRIMCLTIVTNEGRGDTLFYVPGAKAVTDPPKKLGVFIKQRRRWINGSNFATLFVLAHFVNIYKTDHKCGRKSAFTFLFIYQVLNTILAFMLPGCSYAAFSVLVRQAFKPDENDIWNLAVIIENVYLLLMLYILMWSLAKEVTTSDFFYGMTVCIFGLISYCAYYCLYLFAEAAYENKAYVTLGGILILLAVFTIPPFMNIHRINGVMKYTLGFFVYLFFTPFYLNVLIIYSFANTHDVTWGNRPDTVGKSDDQGKQEEDKKKAERELKFKSYRTVLLCVWMTLNILTAYFILNLYRGANTWEEYYMAILMAYIGFIMISRLIGSICFTIVYEYCHCGYGANQPHLQWPAPLPLQYLPEIPELAMKNTMKLHYDHFPSDLLEKYPRLFYPNGKYLYLYLIIYREIEHNDYLNETANC